MRLFVLSVRDSKADFWHNPFYSNRLGEAERGFSDEVNSNNNESLLAKHPEDYELFHLGFFESDTGVFELMARPVSVITGSSAKRS